MVRIRSAALMSNRVLPTAEVSNVEDQNPPLQISPRASKPAQTSPRGGDAPVQASPTGAPLAQAVTVPIPLDASKVQSSPQAEGATADAVTKEKSVDVAEPITTVPQTAVVASTESSPAKENSISAKLANFTDHQLEAAEQAILYGGDDDDSMSDVSERTRTIRKRTKQERILGFTLEQIHRAKAIRVLGLSEDAIKKGDPLRASTGIGAGLMSGIAGIIAGPPRVAPMDAASGDPADKYRADGPRRTSSVRVAGGGSLDPTKPVVVKLQVEGPEGAETSPRTKTEKVLGFTADQIKRGKAMRVMGETESGRIVVMAAHASFDASEASGNSFSFQNFLHHGELGSHNAQEAQKQHHHEHHDHHHGTDHHHHDHQHGADHHHHDHHHDHHHQQHHQQHHPDGTAAPVVPDLAITGVAMPLEIKSEAPQAV